MRKDALSENLTKLNTLLVKAVQVPYKALEHDLILKVSKKSTKGGRCKLITDDNAGWTFALEVLIQVLIFFAAGKCWLVLFSMSTSTPSWLFLKPMN